MRSDVTLYIAAIFFFILAIITAVLFTDLNRVFWVSFTITLGILFILAGYSQGPIAKKAIKTLPTTPTESITTEAITHETSTEETSIEDPTVAEAISDEVPQTVEAPVEETETMNEETTLQPTPEEPIPTTATTQDDTTTSTTQVESEEDKEMPLTSVKGVREKRAAQLNTLGIHTVKELSQTSVEYLIKNLRPITQKQAADLIEAAKQQLKQQA